MWSVVDGRGVVVQNPAITVPSGHGAVQVEDGVLTQAALTGLRIETAGDETRVCIVGPLTVREAGIVYDRLEALTPSPAMTIDLGEADTIDTIGAWLVYRFLRDWRVAGTRVRYANATPEQEKLIEQAKINDAPCEVRPPEVNPVVRQLAEIGRATVAITDRFGALLAFLGLVLVRLALQLARPWRIRWTSLSYHMEHVGLKALPIVGLMSFLIGLVLVQQGAYQLRRFGAEIFVVDMIGIATLRELGVLLTAIMVAGRSGSAFTAQIGTMKLTEEVDAMRTIGLDPIDTLVLPRLLALVILMPLLVFYAGMVAIAGGMVFGWLSLDIPVDTFFTRVRTVVTMDDFLVGMIKAPVFGMVIAVAGCFEGMQVAGDAASVGERTTISVVESIFMVIVFDAFFAVFFTTIGM